jgi:hypothetical protein
MNALLPYWPRTVVTSKFKTAGAVSLFLMSAFLMLS